MADTSSVFRIVLLLISLVSLLTGPAARAADPAATEQAWAILKARCAGCHSPDGKAKGGFDYVLDRQRLVARQQLVPGQPGDSPLWQRIQQGEMPPPGKQKPVPPGELALLKRWIESGAPALPGPALAIGLARADVQALVLTDLQSQEPRQRRFLRYLTFSHLALARLPAEEMQRHRHALAKLVNSLSWHSRITRPTPVDPGQTVFRIDLRDYRWSSRQWDRLTAIYPYRLKERTDSERKLSELTGSDISLVRGDWFLATASRPPFYHEFLQLPAGERALERLLNVEVQANLQDDNAVRAGFNGSGVARSNRIIERHDAAHGAYWRSYDFTDSVGRQNVFEHPLGPGAGSNAFQHSGGEIIFHLPNGLQGYLLVDGRGQRVDKAPAEIVSDPRRSDRLVENGLSCLTCHVRGLLPKDDQVRSHVLRNPKAFSREDQAAIKALYVPAARMKALMAEDMRRFAEALGRAGVPEGDPEPIDAAVQRYEAVLDLTVAASEVGLTTEAFADRLQRSPGLSRLLGSLLARGGTVQRQLFQENYSELVRVFTEGQGNSTQALVGGLTPFSGHRGAVRVLAISPDGKRAATGGEDGTVRLWELPAGVERLLLQGHGEEVKALAFSGDGRRLLSGGRDRTLRLWDLQAGRELLRLRGHTDGVRSVAVSADGLRAVSGGDDRTVRLWDLTTGQELRAWTGPTRAVTSVAMSADGRLVLAGSLDGKVHLWDAGSGQLLARCVGHEGEVYSVALSPDGRQAVSGGNDRTVRLWDVSRGQEVRKFPGHGNAVITVAFSPDGRRVLSASSQYQTQDRIIRVWDAGTGAELAGRETAGEEGVESIAFSRDGSQVLVRGAIGSVRLWTLGPQD